MFKTNKKKILNVFIKIRKHTESEKIEKKL